jgi:hypothetical protein
MTPQSAPRTFHAPQIRSRRTTHAAGVWVVAFTLAAGSAMTLSAESDAERLLAARFLARQEEPLRSYRAFRRMHAWSERFKQEAWLEARTELKDGKFNYEIVTERGSDTIRDRVLRALLKREQELVNSGTAGMCELTSDNYDFTEAGRDTDGTRVVQITPRRKDVLLVEGKMVLSPDGADLLRVEGRLAKSPSFWTSLVNIVRHYARLNGVRVPVATESTAKVKFVGTSQLEVAYEYESVNERRVSLSAQRLTAPSRTAAR